jgi:hypothetical protein
VAWICSFVAPAAFVLAALALGSAIAAERGVFLSAYLNVLTAATLGLACVGVFAHVLLVYQVHRGTGLAAGESSRLAGLLQFGVGYAEWRETIRRHASR